MKLFYTYVKNYSEVPLDSFTRPRWREMGYKVRRSPGSPHRRASFWNGMNYVNLDLYSPEQVEPIRGQKAKERRERSYILLV